MLKIALLSGVNSSLVQVETSTSHRIQNTPPLAGVFRVKLGSGGIMGEGTSLMRPVLLELDRQ